MPSVRARRLCPEGIFLPPDFDAYRIHSNRFREVLLAHTPFVEPISLDEAFLDVGGATMLFGSPVEIATRIRQEVAREVGVTCSVGIAPTKFVAKLASDGCKPDGLLHVSAEGVAAYLEPLPVGRLWGVGEKTAELLGRLAIRTVGDLGRTPADDPRAPDRCGVGAPSGRVGSRDRRPPGRALRAAEVDRARGDVRSRSRRRGRDPAGAAGAVGTGGGSSPRGRLPSEDRHTEGPARELHDAHPVADAGRSHRSRRGPLSDRVRAVPPPPGETATGAAARASRRAGLVLGGRAAAGADALRALGRRGAHRRPDRASLRSPAPRGRGASWTGGRPVGSTRSGPSL